MKKYLFGLVLMLITAIAFALPRPSDVENAMAQGNFSDAQSMTAEVLREHPESARAHLLNAYLLIHVNHDKTAANAELNTASGLDRKGDVKNSSLFGRTVAEIDMQKSAPSQTAQQQPIQTSSFAPSQLQPEPKHSGHGVLIFVILVFGVGGLLGYIFIRGAYRKPDPFDASPVRSYPSSVRPSEAVQVAYSQPAPMYPAQPMIVQQAAPVSQGMSFGGQMAATAGGVIAGEAIYNAFKSKPTSERYSSAGDYDDNEAERRRRERDRQSSSWSDTSPAYDPPARESVVSSSNERASYSSGSNDSWTPPSSSDTYSSSSSSDSSSSWSDTSSSSSGGDSW